MVAMEKQVQHAFCTCAARGRMDKLRLIATANRTTNRDAAEKMKKRKLDEERRARKAQEREAEKAAGGTEAKKRRGREGGTAAAAASKAKPGDWLCPRCADHQFARNSTCRKCGEPKPAA